MGFALLKLKLRNLVRVRRQQKAQIFPGLTPGHFVQYVADNVDHNVCTLDGQNTFHGMGIIGSCYFGHASRFSNTEVFHHSCSDSKYWKD